MSEQCSTGEPAVVVGIGGEVGHGVAAALLAAGYRLAASGDQPAVLDAARAEFGPVYGESFEPLQVRQ